MGAKPSAQTTAIGFVESSSIARGIEATDAILKRAAVELLMTAIIPRGKYLIMIGGSVADVESSMMAGLDTVGPYLLDSFIIPNAHEQLPAAIRGRVRVEIVEAVGVIETKEVASAIYAGDAAAKAASVALIEARNQPGGKGLVVVTGEVGAVRAAIAAGVETIKKEGMLIHQTIIPYAHSELAKTLLG